MAEIKIKGGVAVVGDDVDDYDYLNQFEWKLGKWRAVVYTGRKQNHLGYFNSEKLAHQACLSARCI